MLHSLKTQLSLTISFVVLLTVAFISVLSNFLIEESFQAYITRQVERKADEIATSLSGQYQENADTWDESYIHSIGMSVLTDGYILKVYNVNNQIIWDAQAHNMTLCAQIMEEIADRMEIRYPKMEGDFTTKTLHLTKGSKVVGYVTIRYFGPFFYTENDFQFLSALNTVLLEVGAIALACSVLVGILLAKRLSRPILKTVEAAQEIANGHYGNKIEVQSNTREIKLLIQSINDLTLALDKQEKLRKQLTEDVSHELRTPIAILQTHIEAIAEGVWQASPEHLESCLDEITRMGKLVSDLEKLAKTDQENLVLHKTEVDLLDIIRQTAGSFEIELQNQKRELSVDGLPVILHADRDRIQQALVNLLSNAIKYTHEGGHIWVKLMETPNTAVIRIQDDGIGIPDEELPFIFERFYRADKSRNRKTGGTGIGLAIVKSVVEAHGGKVRVESRIGLGSSFEISLPKIEE